MANKTSNHVERLHRYLPFDPAHDQIYEEYQLTADSLNLDTVALEYVMGAVQAGAGAVVLTGDAGHGKTHLCRRVLQDHLGHDEDAARRLLITACDGAQVICGVDGRAAKPLRVFKDISELAVDAAARQLEEVLGRPDETALVCANEGRLRAILENAAAGPRCRELLDIFTSSFHSGLASIDGRVHVVNLNHQSVAAETAQSLIEKTLRDWLHGRRWQVCQDCGSSSACPIRHNRVHLAPQSESLSDRRRIRLGTLLATAERLGAIMTIRDLLMTVAYLLTGGLRCEDVHSLARRHPRPGWQNRYAYYNLLFKRPPTLNADMARRLPMLAALWRLDPGLVSRRLTDDRLINSQGVFPPGELDLQFEQGGSTAVGVIDASHGIDAVVGDPRNRGERVGEANAAVQIVRSLRRRDFFEVEAPGNGVLCRLGFAWADDFQWTISGAVDPPRSTRIKERLISGLHAVQGMQFAPQRNRLHLVEPAFGRATNDAVIVARRVPANLIRLISLSASWPESTRLASHALDRTVDWNDRQLIVRLDLPGGPFDLHLDLLSFEFLMRINSGTIAEDFFAHDIRRITNFLGRLAQAGADDEGTIRICIEGRQFDVLIDGGVINVEGG